MLYQLSYASKTPEAKLNISRTAGYLQLPVTPPTLNFSSDLRFHTENTEAAQRSWNGHLCEASVFSV